jgi:hypothetical protein
MPGSKRWLFTSDDTEMNDPRPNGHGSCMVSKVAGPKYGVAKNANIVVVKLLTIQGEYYDFHNIIAGLAAVLVDVQDNGLEGLAVLSMSFGCE